MDESDYKPNCDECYFGNLLESGQSYYELHYDEFLQHLKGLDRILSQTIEMNPLLKKVAESWFTKNIEGSMTGIKMLIQYLEGNRHKKNEDLEAIKNYFAVLVTMLLPDQEILKRCGKCPAVVREYTAYVVGYLQASYTILLNTLYTSGNERPPLMGLCHSIEAGRLVKLKRHERNAVVLERVHQDAEILYGKGDQRLHDKVAQEFYESGKYEGVSYQQIKRTIKEVAKKYDKVRGLKGHRIKK